MSFRDEWDATPADIAGKLIGHKIIAIGQPNGTTTLELDNGNLVDLLDAADCCSWFRVTAVEEIDLEDNIVTGVRSEPHEGPEGWYADDGFILTVLSRDKAIARVTVDGSEGNGYYCHSISLRVREGAA